MEKYDLKKELAAYSARKNKIEEVNVPEMKYLTIDGKGDPNTSNEFSEAITSLFSVAYPLKFMSKKILKRDYVVGPLECLWWAEDWEYFTATLDKSQWQWRAMIALPNWITEEHFTAAQNKAAEKLGAGQTAKLHYTALAEGKCLQFLHIGPFSEEGPMIREMHEEYMKSHSLQPNGEHHEIYFSDFRRTKPEALRTIVRQPVRSV